MHAANANVSPPVVKDVVRAVLDAGRQSEPVAGDLELLQKAQKEGLHLSSGIMKESNVGL